MEIRRLKESDYETLVKWWNDWGWSPMPKESLPENGTGGVMIEIDGVQVCAGFLYITNSNIAWLEWVISNKEYRGKDRGRAIDVLIAELTNWAEGAERNVIFSIGKNRFLIERMKKQGFTIDEKPSYEMIKNV